MMTTDIMTATTAPAQDPRTVSRKSEHATGQVEKKLPEYIDAH